MFVLYEELGDFRVGHVLQDLGGALQVESPYGKRSKIKSNIVLLHFKTPQFAQLLQQAQAMQFEFDAAFLWECAPQEEFDFQSLAQDYFGTVPDAVQATAVLLALHAAPLYFHRKGRGKYRAAPPDILQAALACAEKKRLALEQQQQWADALMGGQAPPEIIRVAAQLLAKPDKNGQEYKALQLAMDQSQRNAKDLLLQTGAFSSEHDMHRRCFEVLQFPRGTAFSTLPGFEKGVETELSVVNKRAFSIDDITTTEIDDAFSVEFIDNERARLGVHIAAPGLLFGPKDPLAQIARERLSTVYMPGDKITMMPEAVVERATLAQGRMVAVLSLYVDIELSTGKPLGDPHSCIERITVEHNLRHNTLDELVTRESLSAIDPSQSLQQEPFTCARELALLWRVTQFLSAQRDQYRGKTENLNRIDYNFYVQDNWVEIVPRRRDAPLDLLVAELMIMTNQIWGALLQTHERAGIYRVQPPGARVRMGVHAAPHVGLGVPHYAWTTSPLRRYIDLVNQWQLIALLQDQPSPFSANDAELFAIVSAFETTYKAYSDFQTQMERYWCLRWLEQHKIKEVFAHVVREDLLRLRDIPLVIRVPGFSGKSAGTLVRLQLQEINFVEVDVSCRVVEICEQDRLESTEPQETVKVTDVIGAVSEVGVVDALNSANFVNSADVLHALDAAVVLGAQEGTSDARPELSQSVPLA